jgi:ribosome-associated protein
VAEGKRPKDGPRLRSSHERGPVKKTKAPRSARDVAPRASKAPRPPAPKKREKGPAASATSPSVASDVARDLAITIAVSALEKKAVGLEILDVAGRVDYADFLVLMSGRSDRQVSALAQAIEEAVKKKGKRPLSVEGMPHASWVLMDFGDVVVHVFQEDARNLYDLEGLWMDARRLPVPIPEGAR